MPSKSLFAAIAFFLFFSFHSFGQVKQSIIYEAVSMLNAKHQLSALLLPSDAGGFNIINPITGETEASSVFVVRAIDTTSPADCQKILKEILKRNAGVPIADDADLIKAYQNNPFLHALVEGLTLRGAVGIVGRTPIGIDELTAKISGASPSVLAGGGPTNILSNIVNGTAEFLIKRAQEEISITVFEKLQQFLNRYPELDTLFPKTCALIKPFEAYEYAKKLQAIKDAIHEDLKNLVPRIQLLYSIPRYQLLNKKVPSLSLVFAASTLITDLDGKSGVPQSLQDMETKDYMKMENNYVSIFKIVCLLSGSVRAQTMMVPHPETFQYISPDFITGVTQGKPVLVKELSDLYLGLIWQYSQSLYITSGNKKKTFSDLLSYWSGPAGGNGITRVQDALAGIVAANSDLTAIKKAEIDEAMAATKDIQKKIERFQTYSSLVQSILALTELYTSGPSDNNSAFRDRIHEIRIYLPSFTQNVSDMIRDFDQEQYNLGINAFSQLLQTLSQYFETLHDDKYKAEKNATIALLDGDISSKTSKVHSEIDALNGRLKNLPVVTGTDQISSDMTAERLEITQQVAVLQAEATRLGWQGAHESDLLFKWSKIIEYMDLLASITQAENSAAVESLLESYALPAGSSRVKKETNFNIAVQAYVGAFFGRSNTGGSGFTNTYGLTAPIGISFSLGLNNKEGSLSLFTGVFDIGGVINYKLNNQGQYEQNINFAGLVSPSIQVVYGFFDNLPISAGLGCQWTSPSTTTSNAINLSAHFNAFVGIDIPLFNLTAVKKE